MNHPHRGDVFWAQLDPVIGSEQGKMRPVVIIQNDIFNEFSPVVTIAAITTRESRGFLTDVPVTSKAHHFFQKDSVILTNQVRTIDKKRLREFIGHLSDEIMQKVNQALLISLQLIEL